MRRLMSARALLAVVLIGVPYGALAEEQAVDLSINGLALLSPTTSEAVLADSDDLAEVAFGSTYYRFLNVDGSQILTLDVHPGSIRYSVATVSVAYRQDEVERPKFPGGPAVFITGLGIQLGMSRDDVEAVMGAPSRITGDTAIYEIDGRSEAIARYNMPGYAASYTFERGKLVAFQFGFPYP